jgi:xanthine dehydrogenase accessory factor
VTLWTEILDQLPLPDHGVVARGPGERPLAVSRLLAAARGQGLKPATCLVQGWLVEPVAAADRQVWVWGAGHVGRALVAVLAPLPGVAITWIDTGPDRFPSDPLPGVTAIPAADPALLADHAPQDAEHLVLTYSHALDLELCHRLLARGFRSCGLIGSATKWARFRSRLAALGHAPASIARIRCPIGEPALGKHPQAIAIGVAADLLRPALAQSRERQA